MDIIEKPRIKCIRKKQNIHLTGTRFPICITLKSI